MKRILVIDGHPNKESLCYSLAKAYYEGAEESGAEVKRIRIADLSFEPNLAYGYQKRIDLEPDLTEAVEAIKWADHTIWLHPVWWGSMPAIMKGFIDRAFLPGITYQPRKDSLWWDKLLKGKTARIITTIDQPAWYYKLFFGKPSVNQLKKSTLEFCGVKPVKVTYIGIVKTADNKQREKWIEKARLLGERMK